MTYVYILYCRLLPDEHCYEQNLVVPQMLGPP